MTNNLPVTQFNYGETEYKLYYDIEVHINGVQRYTFKENKLMFRNNHIAKQIQINQNTKLIDFLKNNFDLLKRFVKKEDEDYKEKDNMYRCCYFNISKALLSYVIQNKKILNKKLYVEENKLKKIGEFVEPEEIFQTIKYEDGREVTKTVVNVGLYKHIPIKIKNKIVYKNIVCKLCNTFFINNQLVSIKKEEGIHYLYKWERKIIYTYDLFLNCLKDFFESININNNSNFDEYIENTIDKLTMIPFEEQLKIFQNEVKENNKLKRKQYNY